MNFTYAAYFLAIKDDFCLEESIRSLQAQGVTRILVVSPLSYWSTGQPQPQEDFDAIEAIVRRTGVSVSRIQVEDDGSDAIYAEASYRNYAVNRLSDWKPDCVLTVDADELWPEGTLQHLDMLLAQHGPNARVKVTLPMIPVIGVPGLPVEGAKDRAVVATPAGLKFSWGRCPKDVEDLQGTQPIFHFSATRRTLAEVVSKHKLSAHYSDPTYDFDGWLEHVLPNVHVGLENAHMYKSPENIWPLVRN